MLIVIGQDQVATVEILHLKNLVLGLVNRSADFLGQHFEHLGDPNVSNKEKCAKARLTDKEGPTVKYKMEFF